jgi:hypothetical protein
MHQYYILYKMFNKEYMKIEKNLKIKIKNKIKEKWVP